MSRFIDYKEPNFVILLWEDDKPTPIAAAESISVIRAAWPVAVEKHQRYLLTLQQGARVIDHSDGRLTKP